MKDDIIREVYDTLVDRKNNPTDSYTSQLMQDSEKKAEDKILEKLGEVCRFNIFYNIESGL